MRQKQNQLADSMAHRMAAALKDAKDVKTEMSDTGRDADKRHGPSDSYGTTNRRTAVSPQLPIPLRPLSTLH